LISYALQLGSDCPFFIKNHPCYATGRGENLEEIELNLSSYKIVLVYPQIHIHTGQAFSKIIPSGQRTGINDIIGKPITEWKNILKNDFEEIVFADYPEIKQIKEQLYRQGAIYASMSGSGSSVYGLFRRDVETEFVFSEHYFVRII